MTADQSRLFCQCQLRLSLREVRFSPLAVADVHKHVDGTGQSSGRIEQRRWIGDEGNTRAVGSLSYRFHATDRSLLPQCHRHRALIVWQRSAIRPIELPGAPELAVAKFRAATP